VLVEPLGEDFWIVNGQELTFTASDEVPTVTWYENGAAVWVNVGDPYDVVVATSTGEVVVCGYQRPPGAFDSPKNS
jgi:hypothetical protein